MKYKKNLALFIALSLATGGAYAATRSRVVTLDVVNKTDDPMYLRIKNSKKETELLLINPHAELKSYKLSNPDIEYGVYPYLSNLRYNTLRDTTKYIEFTMLDNSNEASFALQEYEEPIISLVQDPITGFALPKNGSITTELFKNYFLYALTFGASRNKPPLLTTTQKSIAHFGYCLGKATAFTFVAAAALLYHKYRKK